MRVRRHGCVGGFVTKNTRVGVWVCAAHQRAQLLVAHQRHQVVPVRAANDLFEVMCAGKRERCLVYIRT